MTSCAEIADVDAFLSFLENQGVSYDDEMIMAKLPYGFIEGRRFRYDGQVYVIYRHDDADADIIKEAKAKGSLPMDVSGMIKDVPIWVVGSFLIQHPQDVSQNAFPLCQAS